MAAGVAALAGWGVVVAVGRAYGSTPGITGSLVQGMLGGVVVALAYLAVAYVLDRPDLRPLIETVLGRLRRRRGEETT